MSELITIGFGILIIPTLLAVISPLIDKIFTDEVVEFINNGIGNIDAFIGSTSTNILLIIIALILFYKIIKRILKILHGNQ